MVEKSLKVHVIIDVAPWKKVVGVEKFITKVIKTVGKTHDFSPFSEVSVLLTGDLHIQELNHLYRGKNKPTNVLSFPVREGSYLGDMALSFDTLSREAKAEGKPFQDHLAHLGVHGFLHLLGYDHETDAEAKVMETQEVALLKKLGIENPYA